MFKELAPYLRQRAVLLTVTHLEEDQIRVNVIPQGVCEKPQRRTASAFRSEERLSGPFPLTKWRP